MKFDIRFRATIYFATRLWAASLYYSRRVNERARSGEGRTKCDVCKRCGILNRLPPYRETCGSIETPSCNACSREGACVCIQNIASEPAGETVLADPSWSCQACADVPFVLIPAAAAIFG